MLNTISFMDAVRKDLIKEGDLIDPNGCFTEEFGYVVLKPEVTGYEKEQKLVREDGLKWIYAKDYRGLHTLFSNATDAVLYLSGIRGYANAIYILNKITSVYSNHEIGLIARSFDDDDCKFLREKKMNTLTTYKEDVFVADTLTKVNNATETDEGLQLGIRTVYTGAGTRHYESLYECDSGNAITVSKGFRPVVSILTSDILVDVDSKKNSGVWKLVKPKKYKEY